MWPPRRAPRRGGTVGLIYRSGARQLANALAVTASLAPLLAARGVGLLPLNDSMHAPRAFAPLAGVVGVHGSALGNVHACQPVRV